MLYMEPLWFLSSYLGHVRLSWPRETNLTLGAAVVLIFLSGPLETNQADLRCHCVLIFLSGPRETKLTLGDLSQAQVC